MSPSWTKVLVSGCTALSLAAALVVTMFSQSHAAFTRDLHADSSHPCAEHVETAASSLAEDNCKTLCNSADLNHLIGVAVDRHSSPELVALPVSYHTFSLAPLQSKSLGVVNSGRDLAGTNTYLTTHRLRL